MNKTSKNPATAASSKGKSSNAAVSMTKPINASESQVTPHAAALKAPSKQQQLAALLVRDEGAIGRALKGVMCLYILIAVIAFLGTVKPF